MELISCILIMPYFAYKGYKVVNLDGLKGSEKYKIKNYLLSRNLEMAMVTVPGLLYLMFGFFNIVWAMRFMFVI